MRRPPHLTWRRRGSGVSYGGEGAGLGVGFKGGVVGEAGGSAEDVWWCGGRTSNCTGGSAGIAWAVGEWAGTRMEFGGGEEESNQWRDFREF